MGHHRNRRGGRGNKARRTRAAPGGDRERRDLCPRTSHMRSLLRREVRPLAAPLGSSGSVGGRRGTPGVGPARRAAQEHLEDLGVLPELALGHLPRQVDDHGVGREGAEEARLQHERVAVLVDAHVVDRVVLATHGLVRALGKIVEALVQRRLELGRADAVALLLPLLEGLGQVVVPREELAGGVEAELVLLVPDVLQYVLDLRQDHHLEAVALFDLQHCYTALPPRDVLLHEDLVVVLEPLRQGGGDGLERAGLDQAEADGVVLPVWLHDEGDALRLQEALRGRLQVGAVRVLPQELPLRDGDARHLAHRLREELVLADG
eukprot:CAMPEP_0179290744 /NCGR_PEP_ID=MMETSP0797-20121207/41976_1 /TAXON_ID=47934 /ORGANISM="Dinophysis acuminata, Strain DAEP01" /LENGTH=320 /DNA_ID=CAMNT_0020999791 /DNA_START=231 /DNA_END=1189 /DNA_ORIENTATION=-